MAEQKDYIIHPQYIILFLVIAGISALFLGFTFAYLYNRIDQNVPPVQLPSLFYWNTLLLIISSLSLIRAKKAYQDDKTDEYRNALIFAFLSGLLFLIAQYFAWKQLEATGIFLDGSTMASYLYVISGLHFLHVIAGLPFLFVFIYKAYKYMKTPVSVLLYFSDLDKKRHLDLLNYYWHFLDGLWIYLVLFFLINYLI